MDIPPNMTIYINNLNEKTKIEELKKSLHAVFSQFGNIVEVLAFKTLKHRGQAWVVFEEVSAGTNALRQMQGFPFYDKPMRIQYAKTKSDAIAKADGTFVPREKRRRQDEKAERRRREQHHDAQHSGAFLNAAYPSAYGAASSVSQLPFHASKPTLPEAPAPPNNILFIQNLPHETTSMMLQMLFCQYPGFREVRMIETKPGIAFVEYGDEMQATVSMQALQGFKITPQNHMLAGRSNMDVHPLKLLSNWMLVSIFSFESTVWYATILESLEIIFGLRSRFGRSNMCKSTGDGIQPGLSSTEILSQSR